MMMWVCNMEDSANDVVCNTNDIWRNHVDCIINLSPPLRMSLVATQWRSPHHCLNTAVVLAAVHGLLGLLRVGANGRATHSFSLPPPSPSPSPSLISLMVSVDVKHHIYLLTYWLAVHGLPRSFRVERCGQATPSFSLPPSPVPNKPSRLCGCKAPCLLTYLLTGGSPRPSRSFRGQSAVEGRATPSFFSPPPPPPPLSPVP